MNKQQSTFEQEKAPGIFDGEHLTELSLDNTYGCSSYDDGKRATVFPSGFLAHCGYDHYDQLNNKNVILRNQIGELLEQRRYPDNVAPQSEARRVKELIYYDSSGSGFVGNLLKASALFENLGVHWQESQNDPDARQAEARLFLLDRAASIKQGSYFEKFDYKGEDAAEALIKTARSLHIKAITQRRLATYDAGAYVASRRGKIWVAINTSRKSDMPYFQHAVPLAGFALSNNAVQHRATFESSIITPVVIGVDEKPYLAPKAFSSPFTLR